MDDVVMFVYECVEEWEKWVKMIVVYVGEGSRERVRFGVCIGEFYNKFMDCMFEDVCVSVEVMGVMIDKVVWVLGMYEVLLVVENML